MPDHHDPEGFLRDTIEEAVRCHDDLPVRKVGKFWDAAARFRKKLEPAEDLFGVCPKSPGGLGPILAADIVDTDRNSMRARGPSSGSWTRSGRAAGW
jgi:hypothetical protein